MTRQKNISQSKNNIVVQSQRYEGPIPHSSELLKYNEVDPTFANRVMIMAEQNAQHVREINNKQLELKESDLDKGYKLAALGQKLGFIILIIMILSGAYLISTAHEIIGTCFSLIGIAPILKFFFHRPSKNN
jgi:uncharacterized membrane protein